MAQLSFIRRMHLRDGLSVREISRRTKLSRNTITKYLRNGQIEPRYPRRHGCSALDPFAAELSDWLAANQRTLHKRRRTVRQLYVALVAKGYSGSYDRVAAFARAWCQAERERTRTAGKVFVPLTFDLGEAFQFDWSEEEAVIAGKAVKLCVAQFKLTHSRAFVLRTYWHQRHEMLFGAHNHALALLGGVPRRGIYDNMKVAVDQVLKGKARSVNRRFHALTSHYLFEHEFCTPRAGWEKGRIEKNVLDTRRSVWSRLEPMPSLAALNDWLQAQCLAQWQVLRHPELRARTLAEVWQEEVPCLMRLPAPFDGFVEQTKRVTPTCLIHVERNRYSVPASFANRPVSVRLYHDRVVAVAEGSVIAEHARVYTRAHDGGRTIFDWRHYLSAVQRKPGALRNGAPFKDLPEGFRRLQAVLLPHAGGDRQMVEILSLVLQYDEDAVLTAVELALEQGAPSKPHLLNLLGRLLGETPPAPMDAPPTLRLQVEPVANAARYDHLREVPHVA